MTPDPRRLAATTTRSVLATAGLLPGIAASLVRNRGAWLSALGQLPTDPTGAVPRLIAPGLDGLGERLVRATLSLADDDEVRADLTALAQAGVAPLGQVQPVLDALQASLLDPIAALMGLPDARLRMAMVSAVLGGLIGSRNVLRVEPLASASVDQVVALLAPTVQRLLDPTSSL